MLYITICFMKCFKPDIAEFGDLLNLEGRGGELYLAICLAVNLCEEMS